jgi:hypothetical protein
MATGPAVSLRLTIFGLVIGLASLDAASATPITLIPGTENMFRDTRGVNNVGLGAGDLVQYGASIQGGAAGSSVSASHTSGFADPPAPCGPLAINPAFCAGAFSYTFDSRLDAGWTIHFGNGPDAASVAAPSLAGTETAVPFPVSVTIAAGATPTTPTIRWSVPGGFAPDALRVTIFDRSAPLLPNGVRDVVHSAALPAASTSYAIPSGVLKDANDYSINFQLIDLRAGFTEAQFVASNNNAMILRRSSSFFNFRSVSSGTAPDVHLPTVGPDPDPTDNLGAPYQFSIEQVGRVSVTFIDPLVAVGYEYAIGSGDPNFESVLLPFVGDGVYDVSFGATHATVLAGEQFFFPADGVAAFRVLGIETAAGLAPDNVLAFITGLTFVSEGSFTGTMTPIVQFAPDASVPEPGTLTLIGTALAAGAVSRRCWRKR